MTLLVVQQQRDRLDAVFEFVERLQKTDLPVDLSTALTAHLTQYLCVRVAGFISKRLERRYNLNAERLCQLAGEFDPSWGEDLRSFLGEDRKLAIGSIVTNRHSIAHGESVSLGFVQMRDWYKQVLQVVEHMERQALC